MLLVILVGVAIGFAFGSVADFARRQQGWRLALAVNVVFVAGVYLVVWRTDVDGLDTVWVMLAYASSGLVVERLLVRRVSA